MSDGTPIRDQPLSVTLEMGARGASLSGKFARTLVGMLKDGLGRARLTPPSTWPIRLGGTLHNVDQSQWREMLVQAPLRKGGGLFDKLLGK